MEGMKKGVLISLILILFAMIIFSIMIIQRASISFEREQFSTRLEVRDLNRAFVSIDRSLHVTSDSVLKRAILASEIYIFNKSSSLGYAVYLNNASENLKELVLNGTLEGNNISTMENNTLTKWINELEDFYLESKGYNVSISLGELSISLNDSFHVQIKFNAFVKISKEGVATISKNLNISERVSLVGFEDPLYVLNITEGIPTTPKIISKPDYNNFTELILTGSEGGNGWAYGKITNNILDSDKSKILVKNNITSNESLANEFRGVVFSNGNGAAINTTYVKNPTIDLENLLSGYTYILISGEKKKVWNVSNFINFVENGYYKSSSSGPSFFDRLEGKVNCSYCLGKEVGLESFIDKNLLSSLEPYGLVVDEQASNIDYLYAQRKVGNYIGLDENSVDEKFYEFKLDNSSFSKYFE